MIFESLSSEKPKNTVCVKNKKKILFQGRVPPPGNSVTADWLPSRGAVLPAVARRQPSPLSTRQTAGPHWRIQLVQCNLSFSQSVIKFKKCEFKKKTQSFFFFSFTGLCVEAGCSSVPSDGLANKRRQQWRQRYAGILPDRVWKLTKSNAKTLSTHRGFDWCIGYSLHMCPGSYSES